MRHRAWLNAAPVAKSKGRLEAATASVSRLKQMRIDRKDEHYQPDMPDIEGAGHIVDRLWEIGPVMVGGMALAPIDFSELQAWQRISAIELTPWEGRLLRRLSLDYLEALREAESPDCAPPWSPVNLTEADRESVATQTRNVMQAFMLARRKPS